MTYLKKYIFQIKQEILILIVFIIITGINEPKTLTKHVLCECKCKFDGIKCKSNQWWNNDRCRCECKKIHVCEKDYIWNHVRNCRNREKLASIMDDSNVIFDNIIDVKETNFNEKKVTCKAESFYILLAFFY